MAYITLAYKPYSNHPSLRGKLLERHLSALRRTCIDGWHTPIALALIDAFSCPQVCLLMPWKRALSLVKDNCFVFMHCYNLNDIRISRHGVPFSQKPVSIKVHAIQSTTRLESQTLCTTPTNVTLTSSILLSFEQVMKSQKLSWSRRHENFELKNLLVLKYFVWKFRQSFLGTTRFQLKNR